MDRFGDKIGQSVLLEPLAMDVPVIASDIAGVPDVVKEGENGLLG